MKKLLAVIFSVSMIVCQGIYGEYLYDEDITSDTGEIIKAHQYSKRFDGQCVEIREGIVESLENSDYNKLYKEYRQEVLASIKEAKQSLKLKIDEKNFWEYYDMCKSNCGTSGMYRLYVFDNENLQSVYNKIRNPQNFMSEEEIKQSGIEPLVRVLPKIDFQEIIQTSIDYDGRRCYIYDKQGTLWIKKVANPGGCNIAFFQNPKGVEVLMDCNWGYDFD